MLLLLNTTDNATFAYLIANGSVYDAQKTSNITDDISANQVANFTNILPAAFVRADPKSAIKLLNLTVFFALLGSVRVKAARRMLVKLTPGLHTFYSSILRCL